MATQTSAPIGTSWTDLNTAFSLTNGTEYILQNTGGGDLYLQEATSAPAATDEGHIVQSKAAWVIQPESGSVIYARALYGQITVTVTERE